MQQFGNTEIARACFEIVAKSVNMHQFRMDVVDQNSFAAEFHHLKEVNQIFCVFFHVFVSQMRGQEVKLEAQSFCRWKAYIRIPNTYQLKFFLYLKQFSHKSTMHK